MPGRLIRTFTVLPHLPDRLQPLQKLAYNLWWCWNHDAIALFRRIDFDLFEALDHSPIRLLGATDQKRFDELLDDDGFLAHMDRVVGALDHYLAAPTWFQEHHGRQSAFQVAYFSMEFGLHESVPVYSGGLGVLAGDHLKSASDLGVPLCGVTLMFREGYFRQYLNIDGWQQERYPENDFFNLPLIREQTPEGKPVQVTVPIGNHDIQVRVWRIQVGRVPLYLLDANIPDNAPADREITARLYGGDSELRIRQELVLGIGGVRALAALGKMPSVCHMNEGHSAFCNLERIRMKMHDQGHDFATAMEAVKAGSCFTTHTPVPAGNDVFAPDLIDRYLGRYIHELGLTRERFLALGRQHPHDPSEPFGMTVLAIRMSNTSNGVSALHGRVSRHMWQAIWPELAESEVPIFAITNGVHTQSWIAAEIAQLYDRYIGVQWESQPTHFGIWSRAEHIPDTELWRTHERCRERLVAMARIRLQEQLKRRGVPPTEVEAAEEVLDPEALTIGFARRFATYKRGTLVFRDLERLTALCNDRDRPVQFIFAGKAHPRDHGGKELIAQIMQYARRSELRRRIVFLEDYDMNVTRTMIHGVDIWLNNPRRPLEASGTSGMKVAANGGLNLSVLDGWWVEGYHGDNGWSIGAGEEYTETEREYQDQVESRLLYDLIERDIVPMFYNRGSDGLPRQWLKRMKRSIATVVPYFNTNRMVAEYVQKCYRPSFDRFSALNAESLKRACELAKWRHRLQDYWPEIGIEELKAPQVHHLQVGGVFDVSVRVRLGTLRPEDVLVQLVHGRLDAFGSIAIPTSTVLTPGSDSDGQGIWTYSGTIPCEASGHFGYCVRVLPHHSDLPHAFEPGLVTWG